MVNTDILEGTESHSFCYCKEAYTKKTESKKSLKAADKEKTATYRQYFGNRMLYKMMLEKYKEYGLLAE